MIYIKCNTCEKKIDYRNKHGLCRECYNVKYNCVNHENYLKVKERVPRTILICPDCGSKRRVRTSLVNKDFKTSLCKSCYVKKSPFYGKYGAEHPGWKGGIHASGHGYFHVVVSNDHPHVKMAQKISGSLKILQHRLVMAEYLGRNLESWECVHHKNGNRSDNRIENLELINHTSHVMVTKLQTLISKQKLFIAKQTQRISELESSIKELQYNAIIKCA